MAVTIEKCTKWSDQFHQQVNDPVERGLRVVQFGGLLLGVSGFAPLARELGRIREYLFCTWIVGDLLHAVKGDYKWLNQHRLPNSEEEWRDLSFMVMDGLMPIIVLTPGFARQRPLIGVFADASWAAGNGLQAHCGDTSEKRTIALFDCIYATSFLIPTSRGFQDLAGLTSGVVYLGYKSKPMWKGNS